VKTNYFHSLILFSLLISAMTMALYAFRNYSNQELAFTVFFVVLALFFLTLVILGVFFNRKNSGMERRNR
jgi:cytochrome c biogenesis factor